MEHVPFARTPTPWPAARRARRRARPASGRPSRSHGTARRGAEPRLAGTPSGRAATASTASASAAGSGVRPGTGCPVDQFTCAAAVRRHDRCATGECLEDGQAEGLAGTDRQRDVRLPDPAASSSRPATCPWKVTGAASGERLELVAVRPVAVDVQQHGYAAPMQVDGGRHGQVRPLLARQPADVDQPQARRHARGLLGWAGMWPGRRRAASGALRCRQRRRPGGTRVCANRDVTTTRSTLPDQQPVEHADGDLRRRGRSPVGSASMRRAARGENSIVVTPLRRAQRATGSNVSLSRVSTLSGRTRSSTSTTRHGSTISR